MCVCACISVRIALPKVTTMPGNFKLMLGLKQFEKGYQQRTERKREREKEREKREKERDRERKREREREREKVCVCACVGGRRASPKAENAKGGSIAVPLTSCLTGLESAV